MQTVNLEQFESLRLDLTTNQKNQVQRCLELAEEVSKFHPAKPFFNLSETVGQVLHYETYFVRLDHPTLDLRISCNNNHAKKAYSIQDFSIGKLKNTNQNSIDTAKKQLEKPQQIGVLNAKKIANWIKYREDLYNLVKAENNTNRTAIDDFLQSLNGLPVQWTNDKKSGEVIANGIAFSFHIGQTYVAQKLVLDYHVEATLQNFLNLSANKFSLPKKKPHSPFDMSKEDATEYLNYISREVLIEELKAADKNGIFTDAANIAEFGTAATKEQLIESFWRMWDGTED